MAPTTARAWLLQQLLDEAAAADPSGAAALQRAAELAPLVDGAALPFKALHAFAARRQLDVALALLRQRPETTGEAGWCASGREVHNDCSACKGDLQAGTRAYILLPLFATPPLQQALRRRRWRCLSAC